MIFAFTGEDHGAASVPCPTKPRAGWPAKHRSGQRVPHREGMQVSYRTPVGHHELFIKCLLLYGRGYRVPLLLLLCTLACLGGLVCRGARILASFLQPPKTGGGCPFCDVRAPPKCCCQSGCMKPYAVAEFRLRLGASHSYFLCLPLSSPYPLGKIHACFDLTTCRCFS